MRLDQEISSHYNQDYNGDNFTWKYYHDWYGITSFMNPQLTVKKYNWTCKSCGVKILDDVQIESKESRNPVYHVKCFKLVAKRMLDEIQENEKAMYAQIDNITTEELYEPMIPDINNG